MCWLKSESGYDYESGYDRHRDYRVIESRDTYSNKPDSTGWIFLEISILMGSFLMVISCCCIAIIGIIIGFVAFNALQSKSNLDKLRYPQGNDNSNV